MASWTTKNIPPQNGRCAVVTGAGGLGFEDALALARAGAEVIIASRDPGKGAEAVAQIRQAVPAANVRFERLDLASLASVADFATRVRAQRTSLDLLINNAGVMTPPMRQATADGFELQLGTNYLGHFALTAHLLPLLRKGQDARVVTLSSVAARGGKIDFDNLNAERGYQPMPVYGQSKLACLMFALELQRRSDAAGWGVTSIAAHPGIARTELLFNAPRPAQTLCVPLLILCGRAMRQVGLHGLRIDHQALRRPAVLVDDEADQIAVVLVDRVDTRRERGLAGVAAPPAAGTSSRPSPGRA
jgi:NAD(P)-dependent dehydrogenase (short-subunit alcohol dehydrogenase family)